MVVNSLRKWLVLIELLLVESACTVRSEYG
jgi:hypothetical protein